MKTLKRLNPWILFLLLLSVSPAWGQPANFSLDFETGNLRGWQKTGNAFDHQPTLNDNPTARHRGQPSGHQGKYWIGTYEKYQGIAGQKPGQIQGDGPTGRLTSAPFTILHDYLKFLIGGGDGHGTRVELLVLDPIEQTYVPRKWASGKNTETMHRVVWNISRFQGNRAKLRIADDDSGGWGHINVDDFRFYNTAPQNIPQQPATLQIKPFPANTIPATKNVRVPNLVNKPYQKALELIKKSRLRLGKRTQKKSNTSPGTVLYQFPKPHAMVDPGTMVHIVIAKPAPLKVWIVPNEIEVEEGRSVKFRARANREDIALQWSGPNGITGLGKTFVIATSMLQPRRYRIILEAKEGSTSSRSEALLRIKPRPKVKVPDLVGKKYQEVEKLLKKTKLRLGRTVRKESDKRPGTVLFQKPKPGMVVEPHSNVDIVLSKRPQLPPLEVRIFPSELHVPQGETVQFKSKINRKKGTKLHLEWVGPNEAKGMERIFAIDTSTLKAGRYKIVFAVREGHTTKKAEALLQIDPKPLPRPVNYTVTLRNDKQNVKTDEDIVFEATIEPFIDNVKYRYHFGDRAPASEWTAEASFGHRYTEAGRYKVYVEAKTENGSSVKSDPTTVSVRDEKGAVNGKERNSLPPWMIIGAGIGILIIAGGLYRLVRPRKPPNPEPKPPAADIEFHVGKGVSLSEIEADSDILKSSLTIDVEKDMGQSRVESDGDIIGREWSSNEKK